jgi:hypothetical protein
MFGLKPAKAVEVFSIATDDIILFLQRDIANPTFQPVLHHGLYYMSFFILGSVKGLSRDT